jgi:hypothetical protein
MRMTVGVRMHLNRRGDRGPGCESEEPSVHHHSGHLVMVVIVGRRVVLPVTKSKHRVLRVELICRCSIFWSPQEEVINAV